MLLMFNLIPPFSLPWKYFVNVGFNVLFELTIQFLVTIVISATFKDYLSLVTAFGTMHFLLSHAQDCSSFMQPFAVYLGRL